MTTANSYVKKKVRSALIAGIGLGFLGGAFISYIWRHVDLLDYHVRVAMIDYACVPVDELMATMPQILPYIDEEGM